MFSLRRDPGPCPVDDAPHMTCTAPTTGAVIVGGPITPATRITVGAPATKMPAAEDVDAEEASPAPPRPGGRRSRPATGGGP